MRVLVLGQAPYLDELTRLALKAGHEVTGAQLEQSTPPYGEEARVDLAVECAVSFSSHLTAVDTLSARLPSTVPLLTLALTGSVTSLGGTGRHLERIVGWGALPPIASPDGEGLIEVARGLPTGGAAFQAALDFWKSLGLEPVEVSDGPGLVRARALCCLINEAVSALADGIASTQDIDAALRLGNNYPKGLLAWADELGLDLVLSVLDGIHRETGDPAYRPHPLLKRKVWAGQLGQKSGHGFFEYRVQPRPQ